MHVVGENLKWDENCGTAFTHHRFRVQRVLGRKQYLAECLHLSETVRIPAGIGQSHGDFQTDVFDDLIGQLAILTEAPSGEGFAVNFDAAKRLRE